MAAAAPGAAEHPQSSSSSSGLLRPGSTIQNSRVFIESGERLGHGTFSEIFLGTNLINKNRYALKVDKPGPRMALQWESDVLLKLQKYPFAARHYGLYTMPDKKLQVLAMQLLGNSISALRRKQPDSFMPYASVCHITLQMLAAIEGLHQEGYIHRDLKPSNFVHGLGKLGKKQIYVIDFGQSRMYVDEAGNVRQARPFADFRGTSLYSSLHAHQLKDLGRRDDLWALWYIFMELARGGLPWKCVKEDRYHCEIAKKWYMENPKELTFNLPGEGHLLAWHAHLQSLPFEAKPDYAFVATCIKGALSEAISTKKALQRNFGAYRENDLFKTIFDETIYRHHSYYHYCAIKQAEAEKRSAGASPGTQPLQPSAPVVGSTTILFWNAELSTACHPSANTLQLLAAQDASGESSDLVALFDLSETPYSSDCVLECRGGVAHSWETDSEGNPVYQALKVNEQGDLTMESDAMVESLRVERATCQAVIDRFYEQQQQQQQQLQQQNKPLLGDGTSASSSLVPPAIDASKVHHNHHSTDMMGPGALAGAFAGTTSGNGVGSSGSGDDGLSPSAGRKRRRNGEVMLLEYGGKSDGYVVSDLTQRLTDLRGVLEKSVQDIVAAQGNSSATASSTTTAVEPEVVARALGTYVSAWRRLAEAALQRFEAPSKTAKTVRADVVLLFRRILDATTAVPPVSYPTTAGGITGAASNGTSTLASAPATSSKSAVVATAKVPSFGDVSTASGSGVSASNSGPSASSSTTTPMTILPSGSASATAAVNVSMTYPASSSASSSAAGVVQPPAVLIANDMLSTSGGMLSLPYVGGSPYLAPGASASATSAVGAMNVTTTGAGTAGDKVGVQVTLGRVEAWLKLNTDKAVAVTSPINAGFAVAGPSSARMDECTSNGSGEGAAPASTSSSSSSATGSGSGGSGIATTGAAATAAAADSASPAMQLADNEVTMRGSLEAGASGAITAADEGAYKAAEERLSILLSILRALDRERDLMRAPIAPENWKSKSGFAPPAQAVANYNQQVQAQRQYQQLHQQQYHLQSGQAPPLTHLSSFTTAASVRYSSASSATSGTGAFMPNTTGAAPMAAGGAAPGTSLFTPLSSAVSGLNLVAGGGGVAAGAGAAPQHQARRSSNGGKDDITAATGGTFVTGTAASVGGGIAGGNGAILGTGGLGGNSTTSSAGAGASEPPAAKRSRVNDGGSAASAGSSTPGGFAVPGGGAVAGGTRK